MDKVKDEHFDKIMSGFRNIDRTLKFRRRTYIRMEKQMRKKGIGGGTYTIKGF